MTPCPQCLPLRILYTDTTAFRLNFRPSLPSITVDEAAIKFKLADLRPAFADYVCRSRDLQSSTFKIGQRWTSPPDAALPFTHLRVWYSVRMQMRSSDADGLTDPQWVSAMPAANDWPFGRYDTVLFANGTAPGSGLGGKSHCFSHLSSTLIYPKVTISHRSGLYSILYGPSTYTSHMPNASRSSRNPPPTVAHPVESARTLSQGNTS